MAVELANAQEIFDISVIPVSQESPEKKANALDQFQATTHCFIQDPSSENLQKLIPWLKLVDPQQLEAQECSDLLDAVRLDDMLGVNATFLLALKIPSIVSTGAVAQAIDTFLEGLGSRDIVDAAELLGLLGSSELLNNSQIRKLIRSILKFTSTSDQVVKRTLVTLVANLYEARVSLRREILGCILRAAKTDEFSDFPVAKTVESGSIHASSAMVLELVKVEGYITLDVWDEAAAYNRSKIITDGKQKKQSAVNQICSVISSFIIENNGDLLVDDILKTLLHPEWASAEAIIRTLVVSLLILCRNYHNRLAFPPSFVFSILGSIQRTLYTIFKVPREHAEMGSIIDYLQCQNKTKACLYCATMLSDMPAKEVITRLTNPLPKMRLSSITSKRWIQLLRAQRIGDYYDKVLEAILALSECGNIPSKSYVEILRSLATTVYEYPESFKRIEGYLFKQLPHQSSGVCEWILQIIHSYLIATNLDQPALVDKVLVRTISPGNLGYKKRAVKLLDEIYTGSKSEDMKVLVWKWLLLMSQDSKAAISTACTDKLQNYLYEPDVQHILEEVNLLGHKYGHLLYLLLRRDGVITPSRRIAIQTLVGELLESLDEQRLLDYNAINVAGVIIRANGLFLPPSKIPYLIQLSVSAKVKVANRLIILRMLNSALSAEPKVILSPRIVAVMFRKILAMFPAYSEAELECAGQIVWELAHLGRSNEKIDRVEELRRLFLNSLTACTPETDASALPKLIAIISVSMRFWETGQKLQEVVEKLIALAEVASLRLLCVKHLTKICTKYPNQFLEGLCKEFFSSILQTPQSEDWAVFMDVFLHHLLTLEEQRPSGSSKISAQLLHGSDENLVADSTINGLMQEYLPCLLTRASLDEQDAGALTAANLICNAVLSSKVSPIECIPTIVKLCFSKNAVLSQTAQDCFEQIVESLGFEGVSNFTEGLRSVEKADPMVFSKIWDILGNHSTEAAHSLVESFSHLDRNFATTLFLGLCRADLKLVDVRVIERGLENIYFSYDEMEQDNPETIAIMIVLCVLRMTLQFKYPEDEGPQLNRVSATTLANPSDIFRKFGSNLELARDTFADLRNSADYQQVFETINSSKRKLQALE